MAADQRPGRHPSQHCMTNQAESISSRDIERFSHALHDRRVIPDAYLAGIYGVQSIALNQAVKRSQERFPADFMSELTREEIPGISQTVTSLIAEGRRLPGAPRTDHGGRVSRTGLFTTPRLTHGSPHSACRTGSLPPTCPALPSGLL